MIRLFVNKINKLNKFIYLPTRPLSTLVVCSNNINKINNYKYSNTNYKLKNEINNFNQLQNKNFSTTTTTTTTTTIKDQEINEIIKKVENNPNDADLLMELCSKFIEFKDAKDKTILLNGRKMKLLELLLQIIDIDPTYPSVFYRTFIWANRIGEENVTIKGHSGPIRNLLFYELANNTNHIDSLTELVKIENDWEKVTEIPRFVLKTDPITGVEKEEIQYIGYNRIQLLLKIIDLEPTNMFAKMGVISFMKSVFMDQITLFNGETKTLKQLSFDAYLENKDKPNAPDYIWATLIDQIPIDELIVTIGDDKEVNVIKFLLKTIDKFPLNSWFYYQISQRMLNNYDLYNVNSQMSGFKDTSFGRLHFISAAISVEELYGLKKPDLLSQYYFSFGKYLLTRDEIVKKFSGKDNWTKVDFFIKALEIDPVFPECKTELVKCMKDNETFKINGKDYSKVDLTLSILDGITNESQRIYRYHFIYSKLIEIYKKQGNQSMIQKYTDLFNENNKIAIDIVIGKINDNPNDHFNWLNLSKLLNGIDKVETVVLKNFGKMNKIELLLKTIQLEPKSKDAHYELSLLLLNDQDTITLLDGSVKNKVDLLTISIANNAKNLQASYNLLKILPDSEFQEIAKLDILSSMVQIDFEFKYAFLEIGIILSDNSIPEITFITKNGRPIISSRKNLICQFLKLDNPEDPTKGSDNILALYYLSLEMENDEIEFGKTKKQILHQIIKKDSTFSRAYSELSTFLNDNFEKDKETELNRIELMVKSIYHEFDLSILSNHYFKLSTYLNDDNNNVVILHDGRIMDTQKLLIESIEINPRANNISKLSLIYKQLGNSLNSSNSTITLFGREINKTELLETALQLSNNDYNYLESLKIKSSLYLDQLNKFIK